MPNLANLPVADLQAGTANWSGQGYIDGLKMQWVSATALTVSSGAAFIPALNKCLPVPGAIAKTGLALTASTWYHVYLWLNAGVPDIEIVTTAPAAAYNGTARCKTGDTSRRYIGSVCTNAGGQIVNFVQSGNKVTYQTSWGGAPLVVLSNGQATASTTVILSSVVPITSQLAQIRVQDTDGSSYPLLGNSASGDLTPTNSASVLFLDFPLDASQAMYYRLSAASTGGGLYIYVGGYYYER